MIKMSSPVLGDTAEKYILDCVRSKEISIQGKYIDQFSEFLCKYIGKKYCVLMNSGTSALHMALLCGKISKGDEVIVPSFSYIATVNPVEYCNGKVVLIDSETDTWNMCPHEFEKNINKKTKAIIATSIYGNPAKLEELRRICDKHGILMIEDACESLGSERLGRKTGNYGDITALSFNGNKIISTGGGGAFLTDNKKYYEKCLYLSSQAKDEPGKYFHSETGYNYLMNNMQAALGFSQLEKIEETLKIKRRYAEFYSERFGKYEFLDTHKEFTENINSFWLYSLGIPISTNEKLRFFMKNQGIETTPMFTPIHRMPLYKSSYEKFINCEKIYPSRINLPCHPSLKDRDIDMIIDKLIEFFQNQENKNGK